MTVEEVFAAAAGRTDRRSSGHVAANIRATLLFCRGECDCYASLFPMRDRARIVILRDHQRLPDCRQIRLVLAQHRHDAIGNVYRTQHAALQLRKQEFGCAARYMGTGTPVVPGHRMYIVPESHRDDVMIGGMELDGIHPVTKTVETTQLGRHPVGHICFVHPLGIEDLASERT